MTDTAPSVSNVVPMLGPVALHREPSSMVRDRLGRWAGAWDELVDASPLPSPFSRSWWLAAVATDQPRFLLVLDGSDLIGGLALEQRSTLGTTFVRMLGSGALCPDHLDMIAAPGREEDVQEVVGGWLGRDGSRVIRLNGVVDRSLLSDALPPPVRETTITVAPWTKLGAGDFLASCSRNLRANVRKAGRRMEEAGVIYRRVPSAEVELALRGLRRLHACRWGRSPFLRAFDRFASASRAGVGAGEFAFHELTRDGRAIASIACFEVAGRVSFYQGGRELDRRWGSAGVLLLYHAIEEARQRDFAEFDLLRGDEPYKGSFAIAKRDVVSLDARTDVRAQWWLAGMHASQRIRAAASAARRVRRDRRS